MKSERPGRLMRVRRWLSESDSVLDEMLVDSQCLPPMPEEEQPDRHALDLLEKERRAEADEVERMARWKSHHGNHLARTLYSIGCILITLMLIFLMLYTCLSLPPFGAAENPINNEVSARYIEKGLQETGAVNIVTGMILDYRAFDTLGESTVLFTAAMVVLFLLHLGGRQGSKTPPHIIRLQEEMRDDTIYEPSRDSILQASARILIPMVFLLGIYIILNGHISPGGGFAGGSIMGAGLILYAVAFGFKAVRRFFTLRTYRALSVGGLLTYAASKCYSFYTGANGIHSIIPLGTPGAILSSGLILVLNICVGIIVTCTMFVFYAMFRKGDL